MEEINLWGDEQKYPPTHEEIVLQNLKNRIEQMIIDNGDYDFFISMYDGETEIPPSFDDFFNGQIEHLIKLHNQSKDWDKFVETYIYN